jgi:hypothetical protein
VVEYNTSTNPVENGTVRDTSGRGLDGMFYNGTSYDATEKAFAFDAASNQYLSTSTPVSGNYVHSISMWFKGTNLTSSNGDSIVWFGDNVNDKRIEIYLESDLISYSFRTNDVVASPTLLSNRWYHLAVTYNGTAGITGREIYLDGVKQSTTFSGNENLLDIDNSTLDLGGWRGTGSTYRFSGYLSNFKFYDVVLTTDEVKRLYDMGRLGNVIAQPVHIAAPLQVEKTLRVPIDSTAAGTTGMIRFNTNSGKLQVYDGTNWTTIGGVSASGGTVSYADGYTIHTFTSSDDFLVYSGGDVEYLVVAGGGGGGYDGAGGGGAGGLLTGTKSLVADTYDITVGDGGAAATLVGSKASNGTNSSIGTLITATGGGGGGSKNSNGADGGSGGGGGHGGSYTGGTATTSPSQGQDGGDGGTAGGGGGGGAGAVGSNMDDTTGAVAAGNGGNGLSSSISGTATYYAGGGGGGTYSVGAARGTGGLGGGGNGGANNEGTDPPTPGTPNTGGGGGADGLASGTGAQQGGSGIVIIRYLT